MSARARVQFNPQRAGVQLAVRDNDRAYLWPTPTVVPERDIADEGAELPESAWLTVPEDVARAIYTALGEYFGGVGVDARALRADYDHERGRVDKLIDHLIERDTDS